MAVDKLMNIKILYFYIVLCFFYHCHMFYLFVCLREYGANVFNLITSPFISFLQPLEAKTLKTI